MKGALPALAVGFILGYWTVPWALRYIAEQR